MFLAGFKVSKDPKRPNMSSFIASGPQNCLSSHKENLFWGDKQSTRLSVHLLTVLAVPAKLAQNKSVQRWFILAGWANLSFPKAESDCCQGLEVADTPI